MALLHFIFLMVAAGFGIRFLHVGSSYLCRGLSKRTVIHHGFLAWWCVLLLLVALQLTYLRRPIMEDGPFTIGERGSFVEFFPAFFEIGGMR